MAPITARMVPIIAESHPPQCGGVPIVGWDWAGVEGEQSVAGTTWGTFAVVGVFDGQALTLTEPPTAPPPWSDPLLPIDPVTTPCPEPVGGWQVVDNGRISEAALNQAIAAARTAPDHSGAWIDHLLPPRDDAHQGGQIVLKVAVTGDVDRYERELRTLWGGALCVVQHDRTLVQLQAIQDELFGTTGPALGLTVTTAAVDETRGVVELGVVTITPEQQAAPDKRYGLGTVDVAPGLQLHFVAVSRTR